MVINVIHPQWPAPATVRAFTTTRTGGVSAAPWKSLNLGLNCGDNRSNVLKNRELVAKMIPAPPAWLKQTHGTGVIHHDSPATAENEADAAVATRAGCVCAVLTADCLPVLFTNISGTEVAAAHAGWKGLAAGVLESTVRHMRSTPGDIIAWIGPCIGPSAYEVGSEVREAFCHDDRTARSAFMPSGARWLADLPMLARQRLARSGVRGVFGGEHCTFAGKDRFFSYRRDGITGRMATLIWFQRG